MSESNPPEDSSELTGSNAAYIERLYERYRQDPDSVDSSWHPFFEEHFDGGTDGLDGRAPSFRPKSIFEPTRVPGERAPRPEDVEVPTGEIAGATIRPVERGAGFAARVEALLQAYRLHGHLVADIDPLGRPRPRPSNRTTQNRPALDEPELDPAEYGISEDDLDEEIHVEGLFEQDRDATIREVVARAEELYCDSIGVEYQNIPSTRSRTWLREQIEEHSYADIDGEEEKKVILQRLIQAECFESFLHQKYVGAKRFALTGGNSLIPMLDVMLDELGDKGVEEVVIGMAHRGRLNVLHNIMDKPADEMVSEFEEEPQPEEHFGSSDVKYHMGYSSDFETRSDDDIHLSLCFNPSHLESVNPTALGRTRAKQERMGRPESREAICPLLMHGDAAFAGQGIVTETLNLARLDGFEVGGTIHVVINNQLGFTTEPHAGRSTTYATDVAQMLEVPIFHVNGNDPEACVRAMKLASRYRQLFHEDVIIDLVCYRRYGHNEGDEPRFTQPDMYETIDDLAPVHELYADQLVDEGVIAEEEAQHAWDDLWSDFNDVYDEVHESPESTEVDSLDGVWQGYRGGDVSFEELDAVDTTVDREHLESLGRRLAEVPDDFTPHRTIGRLLDNRDEMANGDRPINWPFAEALATATLVTEGTPVRFSGQDSIRGTFSHRHGALFDNDTGKPYWPARHLDDDQASYDVYNSTLSEAGVLGFEFGYSMDAPDQLVGWEAQFGDFANGGQVIIDQFISSSEDKWSRLSGLTMLLPHAYEGQGPEHSSARLERFLRLCAEDNMFVCNLTKPAQYFHVLRRQVKMDLRKPLIIMTPKSLLRHEDATSTLEELADGEFRRVIPEERDAVDDESVERVLLCTGKLYYDLLDYAREHDVDDVALVRIEQLYPLDREALLDAVEQFPNYDQVCWVQEEPRNMGSWHYIYPELVDLFGTDPEPEYVGRVASASPATGSKASHKIEQKRLVETAFEG